MVVAREQVVERDDIDPHHLAVQPKLIARGEKGVLAECPPKDVHGLVEELPGMRGIAFRPEIREQLVAADPSPGRSGKNREERKTMALNRATGERSTVRPEHRRVSEQPQLEFRRRVHRKFTAP